MTARLTPERLAGIAARVDAATEGTWEMFDFRGEGGGVYIKAGEDSASFYGINSGVTSPSHEQDQQMVADAALMSHARADVVDLLAEVERLTHPDMTAVRARHKDAKQAFLTGTVGSPPNIEGLSTDNAMDIISASSDDVPDLLAALDAATERAGKAEAALARVEALAEKWGIDLAATEDEMDGDFSEAIHEDGAWRFARDLRGAMEGKP